MLQIALCDDDPAQRDQIGRLLQNYIDKRLDSAAQLTVFSSRVKLLEHPENFDLYVLDVIMPEISGIDLGMKLRDLGEEGAIVYLTASRDHAVDSYLVDALYYLLKPVEEDKLYEVLDKAAALLQKQRAASVQVKTKNGLHLLALESIIYVELVGRIARYHLLKGELVDSLTFHNSFKKEMAPVLDDPRFLLCGSSFVVNLHYVTTVDKTTLTVKGGEQVPLARGYYDRMKKRWGDYWMDKGETP